MPVATSTTISYSRLSYVPTVPSSPDRPRKKSTKKENQFLLQEGSRLHAYTRDKAPYPFSYDRDILELSCLDNAFVRHLKGAASFINFKEDTPKRCLDLGTGVGDWVIDAAKDWEDCTFVGYDLVNVQMPLSALDPSVSSRIEWVHGNLLRQKLPFEDDEFDHVHIHGLAFAVPETKWHSILEEVQRVLRPGGTVEVLEEDAIFPTLPKWFTAPLHTPVPHDAGEDNPESADYQPSQHRQCPPSTDHLPHAHALLEKLFFNVFSNRFLNATPTSMLPAYFSAFFSHVHSPPVFCFAMPPIAPMRPAPPPSLKELNGKSPIRKDDSPILSERSIASNSPRSPTSDMFPDSTGTSPNTSTSTMERARSNSSAATSVDSTASSKNKFAAYMYEEGSTIGGSTAVELHPMCNVTAFTEHSLYMQLRRAVVRVMGLKEAMWEEMKLIIEKDRDSLRIYGWDDTDFDDEGIRERGPSRQKFDAMVQQYKSDMHVRTSLWNTMVHHGWQLPRPSQLSKTERIVHERLSKAILEAKERNEDEEEMKRPCRSVRLLVGVKTLS